MLFFSRTAWPHLSEKAECGCILRYILCLRHYTRTMYNVHYTYKNAKCTYFSHLYSGTFQSRRGGVWFKFWSHHPPGGAHRRWRLQVKFLIGKKSYQGQCFIFFSKAIFINSAFLCKIFVKCASCMAAYLWNWGRGMESVRFSPREGYLSSKL